MLEPWKLHVNFYFLCFSFHFLFFFSFSVVSAFMRPLMLFDPLMAEVPQITLPRCLSLISTRRSPGSHDLLEADKHLQSSASPKAEEEHKIRWGEIWQYQLLYHF